MRSRTLAGLLAFSLGLNAVFLVTAGVIWYRIARAPEIVPPPNAHHPLTFDEDRLGLTPDQRAAFKKIRDRWDAEEAESRHKAMELMIKLGILMVQDHSTSATLTPMLNEVRGQSSEFFVRLDRAIRAERALLNPDQTKIFNLMLRERFKAVNDWIQRVRRRNERLLRQAQLAQADGKGAVAAGDRLTTMPIPYLPAPHRPPRSHGHDRPSTAPPPTTPATTSPAAH
ncbi:MAG: periplasmic heavy metal sensor [bacterium]|nr:periplasmic heavy metal sensor [bacterium]